MFPLWNAKPSGIYYSFKTQGIFFSASEKALAISEKEKEKKKKLNKTLSRLCYVLFLFFLPPKLLEHTVQAALSHKGLRRQTACLESSCVLRQEVESMSLTLDSAAANTMQLKRLLSDILQK